MTDALVHRGPDDGGYRIEPGIALGVRRLSVIDIAHSAQPIASEDGSISTIFNGEIYNYKELRRHVAARGHRLRTEGDTETIVHLYEEYGPAFVERLRGMFAIAVWDRTRRRLLLLRDRMGVKPLYYTIGPFGLAFASEVKALIAGGLIDPALDPLGAELFLAWGYVPGPYTLFKGVRKLMPGSMLVWEHGALREEREYWNLSVSPHAGGNSWSDDATRLLALLRASVEQRMVSDVPIGVMLSGGMDSALIATLMAKASAEPIKTFSVGFVEEKEANELDNALRVARRLGSDHHELTTSAFNQEHLLDQALWHMEEPVADLSQLGFLLLSQLARQSVTVALSGQGADELLGGYRKHQFAAAHSVLARFPQLARAVTASARHLPDGSNSSRGLVALSSCDLVERQQAMSRIVSAQQRLALLEPGFREEAAELVISDAVRARSLRDAPSPLAEVLFLDLRMALVDNMFLYFDKMSMATSLEVRVPFMDHDVVSFCCGLPDSRKVWLTRRKELLRRASRGLLDDAIIDQPKRGFFHAALGTWLRVHRDSIVRETLLDGRARGRGQFRPETVRTLLEHSGRGGIRADQRLFSVFLLERWQRLFIDADRPARSPARARLQAVAVDYPAERAREAQAAVSSLRFSGVQPRPMD